MIMSEKLNTLIEAFIHPMMIDLGFTRNKIRKYWRWDFNKERAMSSFAVGLVGKSLADLGVKRSLSIAAPYGIQYEYCPAKHQRIEDFHLSKYLKPGRGIIGPRWAIEKDTNTLEELVKDISIAFEQVCLPWFEMVRDPEKALDYIDETHSVISMDMSLCETALFLAREIGDEVREKKYEDELDRQHEDFRDIYSG